MLLRMSRLLPYVVTPVSDFRIDNAVSSFERTARLKNSEMLLNIEQMLSYLPDQQRKDIILLIKQYHPLTLPLRLLQKCTILKLRGQLPYVNIVIV